MEMAEESVPSSHQGSAYDGENNDDSEEEDEDKEEDEDDQIEWSKSPSLGPVSRPPLHPAQSGETIPSEVEDNDEDMAPAEMVAEQDDYARFMASIRNRDLNEVRGEIDDEIRVLNNQNKVAMRDSDEITQAMVAQIQVCHLWHLRAKDVC
jgi:DNA excision repair protein ERCC-5